MTRSIIALAGAVCLLGAGLAPAGAQAPAPEQAAPAPGAPEQTAPGEGAAPKLERNQALAAKLAGLVGFVNVACPELRGEPEVLNAAVRRLGVEPEALNGGLLHVTATSYLEAYRKDVPANCRRAIETFGPASAVVPNLVVRR